MRDHTKLRAFRFADELVFLIHLATRKLPKAELDALTSQMRRSVVSAYGLQPSAFGLPSSA